MFMCENGCCYSKCFHQFWISELNILVIVPFLEGEDGKKVGI